MQSYTFGAHAHHSCRLQLRVTVCRLILQVTIAGCIYKLKVHVTKIHPYPPRLRLRSAGYLCVLRNMPTGEISAIARTHLPNPVLLPGVITIKLCLPPVSRFLPQCPVVPKNPPQRLWSPTPLPPNLRRVTPVAEMALLFANVVLPANVHLAIPPSFNSCTTCFMTARCFT